MTHSRHQLARLLSRLVAAFHWSSIGRARSWIYLEFKATETGFGLMPVPLQAANDAGRQNRGCNAKQSSLPRSKAQRVIEGALLFFGMRRRCKSCGQSKRATTTRRFTWWFMYERKKAS